MWSWRLNGSSLSRFWVASLCLLTLCGEGTGLAQPTKEEGGAKEGGANEPVAMVGLKVTLVGITARGDFEEIRAALAQSEGVEKLALDTEAPGLITFRLKYAGEPAGLIEKLSAFFPKKYTMTEKHLPSGLREITISRQGS